MENKEEFEQLYNRLYDENFNELENLRIPEEKNTKKILRLVASIFICVIVFGIIEIFMFANVFSSDGELGSIIAAVVTMFIGGPLLVAIIFALAAVIFKQAKKNSVVEKRGSIFEEEKADDKTYKSIFKQKIINPIIKLALPESEYFYDKGLTREEYNSANWEKYDTYFSEDRVVTNININSKRLGLIMSEVHTEDIQRDSEGRTSHVTLFRGLAGYSDLPKDLGCYIKVVKNKIDLFGSTKDNIKMDMTEFEKIFDVNTDNRIKAMQILTVDVMSELIQLIETTKIKFEFYINHNKMYIRFWTGEVFEPEVFGKAMQYEKLKKYFDIVRNVKDITAHICNVISNTEL